MFKWHQYHYPSLATFFFPLIWNDNFFQSTLYMPDEIGDSTSPNTLAKYKSYLFYKTIKDKLYKEMLLVVMMMMMVKFGTSANNEKDTSAWNFFFSAEQISVNENYYHSPPPNLSPDKKTKMVRLMCLCISIRKNIRVNF